MEFREIVGVSHVHRFNPYFMKPGVLASPCDMQRDSMHTTLSRLLANYCWHSRLTERGGKKTFNPENENTSK